MSLTGGSVRCFLPLSVAPTPTWFLHPLLETAKKSSPHPSAIDQPYGLGRSCQNSDPSQTPLEPMTPVCSLGEAIPHSLWHDHLSWSPAPVFVQFSSPALLGLPEVTSAFHDLSCACPKRTHGRSEEIGEEDAKFQMVMYCINTKRRCQ